MVTLTPTINALLYTAELHNYDQDFENIVVSVDCSILAVCIAVYGMGISILFTTMGSDDALF